MRRLATTAALLFATAGPAAAGPESLPHEKHVLDNGLTVILHVDRALPKVVVNLWYGVGAKDEPVGRSGFAHLFEHLMFMGTERVPGSSFDQLMEAGGGWNNATTSFDRTNYYSNGPAALLPTLLWLEADRLEDLGRMMDAAKLDLQREVVRNERRQSGENRPYGKADLLLTEELFPKGHPYHVSVIGTHEDLEAATVPDVKDFFRSWYVPGNCSLVVAGDFDPEATLALVRSLFGDLPSRPVPPKAAAAPVRLERSRVVTLVDDVQHARTTLAWHSPPLHAPGDAEMDLVAGLLAGGRSSRLHRRLVREEQLALEVVAYQWSLELGSVFVVEATAAPGVELPVLEAAIDEELERLRQGGATEEELLRVRNDVEHSALRGLESLLNRADALNGYQHHFGEPDSLQRDLDRYRRASARSVKSRAREVLDPAARLTLRVLTQSPRDTRPPAAPEGRFEAPAPESFTLGNGLRVHHWRRGELPLLALRLVLPGGATLDSDAGAGLTAATLDMLDEGTEVRDGAAFAEALERLGAELGLAAGRESSTISLRSLERTAAEALGLLAEALGRPAFREMDWERVREQTAARLEARADDPETVARLVAAARLFGPGHPFGRSVDGDPETLRTLSTADLKRRHASLSRPSGAVLLTAGRLDAAALRALLEPTLGAWTGTAAVPESPRPAPPAAERRDGPEVLLVHRPGAVQTVVRHAWPAPAASSPERLGLELVHEIFGGSFTSRLNANLREAHGYTYGAASRFTPGRSLGWMTAASSVRTDVTGAALSEFGKEFARLQRAGLSAADLDKAVAGLRSSLVDRTEGLDGILRTAEGLLAQGRALEGLSEDLEALGTWDRERLNALAALRFRPETGVLVLVGDREAIASQLAGLDLPRAIEVDASGGPIR